MRFFLMTALLIAFATATHGATTIFSDDVEVVEIRETELSQSDETKSVVTIFWKVNEVVTYQISSFDIKLTVRYANGKLLTKQAKADGALRKTGIEVPTLTRSKGKPPAYIQKFTAEVKPIFFLNH